MRSMPRTVAPYGTWTSPITADSLVTNAVGLSQVQVAAGRTCWVEGRPREGGRMVVVEAQADGTTVELLPAGFSARTQVHEYGGRCVALTADALIASNWEDQRLWRFTPGAEPVPLTPEPPSARADRYADPVVTPDGRWVICVRERHRPGTDADHPTVENDLVAVAVEPSGAPTEPVALTGGHDFYSAPRLAPDGSELAWLSWDHPAMPWTSTSCWRAPVREGAVPSLGPATLVADDGAAVQQPVWSPGGRLHHVSDATGWWNVYDAERNLFPIEAETGEAGWRFGTSTYGFTPDGALVAAWSGPEGSGLGTVVDGQPVPVDTVFDDVGSLQVDGRRVVCVAGSPTRPPAVVRVDLDSGAVEVLRASRELPVDAAHLSRPERVRYPTGDGEEAWALVYPPTNPDHEAPAGSAPPLVVMSHGGPTSAASSVLDLGVQYWTSRGFAVADVDYRGSTGYGRPYRRRLDGAWGLLDVEDCAGVVRWLASQGRADPSMAVIRGGSAGGFTTLAALAFTDTFAAGASLYGVGDLELLARDTHKFESRYLDGLIGPWPDASETYQARSPIHHLDGFTCPIILFQGLEDRVVPPAQSEAIDQALRARGIPVAYLPFEGEQHGFRKAETIVAVAEAELAFYGRVLGFTPAGAVDVEIHNADALPGT